MMEKSNVAHAAIPQATEALEKARAYFVKQDRYDPTVWLTQMISEIDTVLAKLK